MITAFTTIALSCLLMLGFMYLAATGLYAVPIAFLWRAVRKVRT